MNPYAIPPLVSAFLIGLMGLLVYLRNPNAKLNVTFGLFCLSMVIWVSGFTGVYASRDKANALWWARTGFMGVSFIPPTMYHFVVTFLGLRQRRLIVVLYLSSFFGLAISRTNLVYSGIWTGFWGYYPIAGPLYPIFPLTFICCFMGGVVLLYLALRQEREPLRKQQLKYVMLAFACGTPGLVDYIAKYQVHIYPFGYLCALALISWIAYAIARYRLMDINVAVTRIGLFLAVYAPSLALPFIAGKIFKSQLSSWVGPNWWMLPAVAEALFAMGGLVVYRYLRQKAEDNLLREQRRYQGMLLNAAKGMTQIHDLRRLLKLLGYLLVRAMKLTHAGIFLWDSGRDQFVLQVQVYPPCKATSPQVECGTHEALTLWLTQERAPVVREEISQLADTGRSRTVSLSRLETRLKNLDAAVVVPSFVNDRLIGFLALGNKRTGTMYSEDDLNMLQTLANQAALAIENAQFYHKERERQAELFQAASLADLGTMASSMSHQLNNPFCIIAGTAQNREEYLRRLLKQNTDLPEPMRHMIRDELESLKSIQEEAVEGSNIIATIRGITASQEESRPLLIAEAVTVALPVVQYKVPFNRLDFRQELPDDLPKIWGNRAQLAQCFVSFIENAWDAINLKQERLKPPPDYKGFIRLAASTVTEPDPATKKLLQWVLLTISDNGIGLKPEDLRKLFIPFFTTKATAEKAVGSLFVVRKIIEAHEGAVSADSTYGMGTTFKVRLPVLGEEDAARRMAARRVTGNGR